MKNKTEYYLIHPQQTIIRWVKAHIDELIEKKMESDIKIEKNDFQTAVEQFAENIVTIAQNIDDLVKRR